MKIYNRKFFAAGAAVLLLGTVCLVQDLRKGVQEMNAGDLMVLAAFLINGSACLIRSLSRDLAREDKINEQDERNRLNCLKAKGRAYDLTIWGGLAAALALALCDRGNVPGPCVYAAEGVFFTCAFAFTAQSILYLYYDKRA